MKIGMIVAVNPSWVIGRTSGEIPWKHKGEQKLFKEVTLGSTVIMGRNTWNGIPKKFRPLPDRNNIVVSRFFMEAPHETGCMDQKAVLRIAPSIQAALWMARKMGSESTWFIGGRSIYAEALDYCTTVHITYVPDAVEGGDLVYFPEECRFLPSSDGWQRLRHTHPHNHQLTVHEFCRGVPKRSIPND